MTEVMESPVESGQSARLEVSRKLDQAAMAMEPKRVQIKVIDLPKGFPIPFRQGTIFAINGIVMRVRDVRKPKPYPRLFIEIIGLVAMEEPQQPNVSIEAPVENTL